MLQKLSEKLICMAFEFNIQLSKRAGVFHEALARHKQWFVIYAE